MRHAALKCFWCKIGLGCLGVNGLVESQLYNVGYGFEFTMLVVEFDWLLCKGGIKREKKTKGLHQNQFKQDMFITNLDTFGHIDCENNNFLNSI